MAFCSDMVEMCMYLYHINHLERKHRDAKNAMSNDT